MVMACSGCQFGLCRQFTYRTIILPTTAESNALGSHLTKEEATMLIDFTIEMSHKGFPLDLKNLGKHALKII